MQKPCPLGRVGGWELCGSWEKGLRGLVWLGPVSTGACLAQPHPGPLVEVPPTFLAASVSVWPSLDEMLQLVWLIGPALYILAYVLVGFPGDSVVKNLPAMWETWVRSLSWEDPLEKGMATYSSIFAWRIPWTEKPGGLQSMGLQRVRHDWVANTFTLRELDPTCRNEDPVQPNKINIKFNIKEEGVAIT